MTVRWLAALLFVAASAVVHADSALDRAYDEALAARAALQKAEAALQAGEEPLEGERQGVVTPAGKRQRSRLGEEYWQRQQELERDVAQARRRYDEALKRWNDLK